MPSDDNDVFANAPPLPSKSNDFPSPPPSNPYHNDFPPRPPSYHLNEPKNTPNKPQISYDDDLGLPSVPNTNPMGPSISNDNNDQSGSIDFDELSKRFQNLKSFK